MLQHNITIHLDQGAPVLIESASYIVYRVKSKLKTLRSPTLHLVLQATPNQKFIITHEPEETRNRTLIFIGVAL